MDEKYGGLGSLDLGGGTATAEKPTPAADTAYGGIGSLDLSGPNFTQAPEYSTGPTLENLARRRQAAQALATGPNAPNANEYAAGLKAAGYNDATVQREGLNYAGHLALQLERAQNPAPLQQDLSAENIGKFGRRMLRYAARAEVPFADLIPKSVPVLGRLGKQSKDIEEAKKAFADGTANPYQVRLLAQTQRESEDDAVMGQNVAGKIIQLAGSAPKIIGEMEAGGAALRGAGAGIKSAFGLGKPTLTAAELAQGGKLTTEIGSIKNAAGEVIDRVGTWSPQAARAALAEPGTVRALATAAGQRALLTPLVPSMWLDEMKQRNLAAGRDVNDWQGAPPALAHGYLQMLVLGSMQSKFGIEGSFLKRTAVKGGIFAGEASTADSMFNLASRTLTGADQFNTKYGTFEHLMSGNFGEAGKEAMVQVFTGALFAGMHEAQHGGEQPGKPIDPKVVDRRLEAVQADLDAMHKAGVPTEIALQRIKDMSQRVQEAAVKADSDPKGAAADLADTTIPGTEVKSKVAEDGAKMVEKTKPPPEPADPLSHVSDSDLRDFAKAMGVPAKGSRQVVLGALASKKISPDVVAAFFPRAETAKAPEPTPTEPSPELATATPAEAFKSARTDALSKGASEEQATAAGSRAAAEAQKGAKPPETPTVAPEARSAGAGETPAGPEIGRPGASGASEKTTPGAGEGETPGGGLVSGMGTTSPVGERLRKANESAVGLTEQQKAEYHAADANILGRMPAEAQARMGKNLENVHVFADTDTMAETGHRDLLNQLDAELKAAEGNEKETAKVKKQIADVNDAVDQIREGTTSLAGLYIAKTNGVYVDGGWKPTTNRLQGRHGFAMGQEIPTEQVRAHEYGHAIDGPNKEYSKSAEWRGPDGAWTKDIMGAGKDAPLSEYGGDPRYPSEGFAEFCRLLYGTDIPTAQIAKDFPNASKFFKDRGLWPPERGGNAEGSAKLPEAFKERIPSDPSQPSHMDVRNDEPLVQGIGEEKGKAKEDEKALANQVTNEMRDRMGLPPVVKGQPVYNEAAWAQALNKIANDPGIATRLVNELEAKPRATTVEENAILLHQRITMSKEHDAAIRQALAGRARGIPDAEQVVLDARQSTAMDEVNRLDQVITRTGTETGRALQFRRQLAREDYSLSTMLGRATLAKGSMLTPDEVKEVHDLHMEVVKADEKLAAAEPGTREAKVADASAKVESAVAEASKAKDEHAKAVEEAKTAATPEAKAAAEEKVAAAKEDVKKAVEAVVEAKTEKVRVEKETKVPKAGEKGDITDLRIESRAAKKRFEEKIDSIRFANLPLGKKVIRTIGESFNAVRTIRTAFDLSAVFRQGGIYAFTHPIKAAKAIPEMLRALGSERAYERAQDAIRNRANGHLYESSGLYLADRTGPLTAREEAFIGRWTSKIPGVKASERAYNAFLNRIRADLFDAGKEFMSRTTKPDPEGMRALANYINVVTGRGPLGVKGERMAGPLATVFFSPRYVVSRFQVLAGQPLYGGTAQSRAFVAREYARLLAGLGVLYGIASMDDDARITFDPRSSDFGKIRYGNTRVDPLAGLAQASVFVTRLVSGETKKQNGQVVPLRDQMRYSASGKVPYGGDTVPDVVSRFIRSKLAPVPGAVADALAGKNVVGEPTTVASTVGHLTVPMSVQDVYKSLEDQGVPRGAAIGLLAILGMGAQTYEPKKPKNESTLEQILR